MFIFSSREVAVVVVVLRYQHSVFVGPRSIPHPTTKIATKKKSITRNISVEKIQEDPAVRKGLVDLLHLVVLFVREGLHRK